MTVPTLITSMLPNLLEMPLKLNIENISTREVFITFANIKILYLNNIIIKTVFNFYLLKLTGFIYLVVTLNCNLFSNIKLQRNLI